MLIGTSLKMYFSHARTLEWVRAATADAIPASVTAFVLPQFPSIPACVELAGTSGLRVGAQDVAAADAGAYTGEVSATVLVELGCRYAEVGHAERRRLFGESDAVVAEKTHAALRSGLTPILCVGESDHVDPAAAADACLHQIEAALANARAAGHARPIVVAYEPVWAIGAAAPADADHIRGVTSRLRAELGENAQVIYGGSAGPGLLSRIAGDVDGLFLGRFAHDPQAFRGILDEAAELVADGWGG